MCRVVAVGVLAFVCGCGVAQDAPPGAKPKAERPKAEQPAEKPAKEKTDYERWQGTWETPKDSKVPAKFIIKGRQVTMEVPGGRTDKLRLRLDTDARPRTVDFVMEDATHPLNGRAIAMGVYQFISDDEIEVTMSTFGFDRPRNFSDAPSSVLKRVP